MDPQQELFTSLKVLFEEHFKGKYRVYDGMLPPDGTEYPFIYLGDSQLIDDYGNKTAVVGSVYQTVHVWSNNPHKRGTLSKVLLELKALSRKLERTKSFKWNCFSMNQQILPDTTTKEPLLHGVLEIGYYFE